MNTNLVGNKDNFAIEYTFVDNDTTEIAMYCKGENILAFNREGNTYTTRWNLDELAFWLRDFLNNMSDDPYPVDVDGIYAAQKDQIARDFDFNNDEEFDAYYDKLDEWILRHRWHPAASGAILADVYFQQVGNNVEISWNNQDNNDDISFLSLEGGVSIDKQLFYKVVDSFLKSYADRNN